MKTAAIHHESLDSTIRGQMIARHDDGTATILFAGSLRCRGREITIEEMMRTAQEKAGGTTP